MILTRCHFSLLGGLALLLLTSNAQAAASVDRFGETLCKETGYFCISISRGESWEKLWPDPYQREAVKRVNRMNISLQPGMVIAIPKNLERLSIMDLSPFPRQIHTNQKKVIIYNPDLLAWAAYDESGKQLWWGAGSGGKDFCPDIGKSCETTPGIYTISHKRSASCISKKYPIDPKEPRAKIPYCMFFNDGIAFHGSQTVPGYADSHGCVRVFTHDARWLNEEFVSVPGARSAQGTTVVILKPGVKVTSSYSIDDHKLGAL